MKTIAALLVALTLALSSCATTNPTTEEAIKEQPMAQPLEEPFAKPLEETKEPTETSAENPVNETPLAEPGTQGQAGGVLFDCNGANLEEFVIDTDGMGYAEALTIAQNCTMITKDESYSGWRLPTVEELLAIYSQLFETGLVEFEETYYWAASIEGSDTAPVIYFGTGFETEFYKDMDFVGLIVVRDV